MTFTQFLSSIVDMVSGTQANIWGSNPREPKLFAKAHLLCRKSCGSLYSNFLLIFNQLLSSLVDKVTSTPQQFWGSNLSESNFL